jgi:hypothetical protein
VNGKPAAKAILVPPRPNLGPERIPSSLLDPELVLAAVLIAVAALLGSLGWTRARRRRRGRTGSGQPSFRAPSGPFQSRREQMDAWSDAVRGTLAVRFGEHWNARTTEEIAADPALAVAIGAEAAAALVRFLAVADLGKFDDRDGLQPPLPETDLAAGWLDALAASTSAPFAPAAAASSMIRGR